DRDDQLLGGLDGGGVLFYVFLLVAHDQILLTGGAPGGGNRKSVTAQIGEPVTHPPASKRWII
ncbi:MAG TPA: hypothetical protein VIR28_25945, partial [Achromobacter sp.]|uniref:hypothetical protein n=1 Tax=Achromobacter sp. TaxID=134375 RepID=UPI002F93F1A9